MPTPLPVGSGALDLISEYFHGKREVMRCLKRYVAREIYRVITATSPT